MIVSDLTKPLKAGEVECRKCHDRYFPGLLKDYYGGKDGRGGLCEGCFMTAVMEPKPLPSPEHLEKVCRYGQGPDTCRFLVICDGKEVCAKGSATEAIITAKAKEMVAKGDYCFGPPDFKLMS